MENKNYIKSGDFYYDGEEWTYFGASIEEFDFDEDDYCYDIRTNKLIPGVVADGSINWGTAIGRIHRFHNIPW